MKKATFMNLVIIISLLIFCVTTLIAIYATAPASSILLLEENFNNLDAKKWKEEISECKEDGERYRYDVENGLISDGVLQIKSNFTDFQYRNKRQKSSSCSSCPDSKNATSDCVSSVFSAKLQTKHVFNVSCGRIEVRAKVRTGNQMRFYIKITPNRNNSELEEKLESFLETANEAVTNKSAELNVFFESLSKEAIIMSAINDDNFHIYVINWDEENISLNIDGVKVDEKKIKLIDLKEESISNATVEFNSTPIIQPVLLTVGLDLQEKHHHNLGHRENKRSLEEVYYTPDHLKEKSLFEMDYIKLFRIYN